MLKRHRCLTVKVFSASDGPTNKGTPRDKNASNHISYREKLWRPWQVPLSLVCKATITNLAVNFSWLPGIWNPRKGGSVQLLTNQTKKAFCVPKKRKSKVLFSGLTRQVRSGGKIQGAIMVQGARFLKEHPKLIMQIVSQIPICLTNQLQPARVKRCVWLKGHGLLRGASNTNLLGLKVHRALNILVKLQQRWMLSKMLEFWARPSWDSRERLSPRSITRCQKRPESLMDSLLHRVRAPPKQVPFAAINSTMNEIEGNNEDVAHPLSQKANPSAPGKPGAAATDKSKISQRQRKDNGSWRWTSSSAWTDSAKGWVKFVTS